MPNHTSTILKLTGDVTEAQRFIELATNGDNPLDFNKVVPMPEELAGTVKGYGMKITPEQEQRNAELRAKFGTDNWYDWCIANWGTKWGAYDAGQWNNREIFYMTAWSPATQFFLTASLQFPNVTFKQLFADEGGSFLGWEVIQNGEVVEDVSLDWNSEEGIALRKELGVWHDEDEETEEDEETPEKAEQEAREVSVSATA